MVKIANQHVDHTVLTLLMPLSNNNIYHISPQDTVGVSMAGKKAREEQLQQSYEGAQINVSVLSLYNPAKLCHGSVLHLDSLFTSCLAQTPPSWWCQIAMLSHFAYQLLTPKQSPGQQHLYLHLSLK